MDGTSAPRALITPLVDEHRDPLPGDSASGALSSNLERAYGPRGSHRAGEGGSATQHMICVTVEITDGPVNRRVRVTAPSIQRALALVGGGKPDREVRLSFPIDLEAFFASDVLSHQAPVVTRRPEIHAHVRRADRVRERSHQVGFSEKPGKEQPHCDKEGTPMDEHHGVSEVVIMGGTKPTGAGRKGVRIARAGH